MDRVWQRWMEWLRVIGVGLGRWGRRGWHGWDRWRRSELFENGCAAGLVGLVGGSLHGGYQLLSEALARGVLGGVEDLAVAVRGLAGWQRWGFCGFGSVLAGVVWCWGRGGAREGEGSPAKDRGGESEARGRPWRGAIASVMANLLAGVAGASVGRELVLARLTSLSGGSLSRRWRWSGSRGRLLRAAGVTAGLAATFQTPVMGAMFAARFVLGSFAWRDGVVLLVSGGVALGVSRWLFGLPRCWAGPTLALGSVSLVVWSIGLGMIAGVGSVVFLRFVRWARERVAAWGMPVPWRWGVAGLGVAWVTGLYPEAWGHGYALTTHALHGDYDLGMLVGLVAAKVLATWVCAGCGFVGGLLTPIVCLGAGLGGVYGLGLHAVHWAEAIPVSAFAWVGLGSVVAAVVRSPLVGILLGLEIAWNSAAAPGLGVACVLAAWVGHRFDAGVPPQPEFVPTWAESEKSEGTCKEGTWDAT